MKKNLKKKSNLQKTSKKKPLQFLHAFFTTLFSAVSEEPHTKSMVSQDHVLSHKGYHINCTEASCSSANYFVIRLTIRGQEP